MEKFSPSYETVHVIDAHRGAVNNILYNNKYEYCVSCGNDRKVILWNPSKAKIVATYEGHGNYVNDICLKNDNTQISSCSSDKTILTFDTLSGRTVRKYYSHTQPVNTICYNDDCSLLLTGSYDKTALIYDLRSRSYKPLQRLTDFRDSVTRIEMKSFYITASSVDGFVRTYDARRGKMREDGIGVPVLSVSMTIDKKCILVGTLDDRIRLIDRADGEILSTYKGHKNTKFRIFSRFSRSGDYVLSGSEDGNIYFWDVVEGNVLGVVKGHHRTVSSLDIDKENENMVSCSNDGSIRVWKRKKFRSGVDSFQKRKKKDDALKRY